MSAHKFDEQTNMCSGLVKIIKSELKSVPPAEFLIPLLSVNVVATVVHAVAEVEITQFYANKEEQPIEAIYYFPVNPDGAVTHFQAEMEGRVIKGSVKPEEEAKKDYDKAVANKTTAFLGKETKADIFMIRVGFLNPGTQVKIIIGYVTEVKNEGGANSGTIRFYIPTTIAPRYVSPSEADSAAKDIRHMDFSLSSPAPLSLTVTVFLQGGIKSIESPTHNVKINNSGTMPENELWHKAMVELSAQTTDMDRDFVLLIVPEETHKPRLYSEKAENGSTAFMVHLIPSFKLDEQKTELIFVLDRSGSMSRHSIEVARKAILLFLHSMPPDCYFNIVGFGSTFQFLFPNSIKYDDDSLKNAIAHTKALEADLGGTEILAPLKEIYGKSGIEGYLRQLFILTDGQVSNTDAVLGIVRANANKARVFALGIGDAASHFLVEGLAKAGGGTSAFVTYNERIDKKVLSQLKNGLQPAITDIELEWDGIPLVSDTIKSIEPNPIDIKSWKQAPRKIPPVHDGSQMLIFALFTGQQPKSVTIKAQSPDGPLTIKVDNSVANDVGQLGVIHRLAAIKLVRELELEVSALSFKGLEDVSERETILRNEIVSISCEIGITSKYTSFVAIDVKDNKPLSDNWVMETRNVPSQLANGWHGVNVRSNCAQISISSIQNQLINRTSRKMDDSSNVTFGTIFNGSVSIDTMTKQSYQVTNNHSASALQLKQSTTKLQGSPFSKTAALLLGKCLPKRKPDTHIDSHEKNSDKSTHDATSSLLQLSSLQSFDGSYNLNDELAAIFNKSLREIREGAANLKLQETIFATALAITFFITKLSTEKDSWELIVKKGRKWLAKTLLPQQIDDVIKAATTFLGA